MSGGHEGGLAQARPRPCLARAPDPCRLLLAPTGWARDEEIPMAAVNIGTCPSSSWRARWQGRSRSAAWPCRQHLAPAGGGQERPSAVGCDPPAAVILPG